MTFAIIFVRLLEVMFFVGLAGSAVVILISFFDDFKELFGRLNRLAKELGPNSICIDSPSVHQ